MRYIVIHHTGIAASYLPEQRGAVENSHLHRGYEESPHTQSHIAYHFLIGADGTLKRNRDDKERTAHTSCGLGYEKCKAFEAVNEQSVAIALAGDFNREEPTDRQIEALRSLVTRLQKRYQIPRDHVIPHQDASPTSCPGLNLLKLLW